MTIVTAGVVLVRRRWRETDRLATLYTERLGKVAARFPGVDKPAGKLKAFSEPLVHAEFRLYGRVGRDMVTVTGGRLIDTHPGLREDLDSTVRGLRMCELLNRLTPERSANPEKYRLLVEALTLLEHRVSPWTEVSFGLRLLEAAGFGLELSPVADEHRETWEALHKGPEGWARLGDDPARVGRLTDFVDRALHVHLDAPLKTSLFGESLARASAQRVHA